MKKEVVFENLKKALEWWKEMILKKKLIEYGKKSINEIIRQDALV